MPLWWEIGLDPGIDAFVTYFLFRNGKYEQEFSLFCVRAHNDHA